MSYQGDAAEQVVRLSLETGEIAVRLAGSGAKQVAILLYAILKDQRKTKGKTRLSNLLRSGKELKVFAVKDASKINRIFERFRLGRPETAGAGGPLRPDRRGRFHYGR